MNILYASVTSGTNLLVYYLVVSNDKRLIKLLENTEIYVIIIITKKITVDISYIIPYIFFFKKIKKVIAP